MPISCRSSRAFSVSLALPAISSKVPSKASHIFFSICITSRLWHISNEDQYGRKKNTLLPPVVPSIIFLMLLPLLASSPSKSYLLKTLVLLQDLFTTQRHWSL